jgi:hypothetical protein
MRLPPFFWPLTLLVLASADCGMTSGHPPVGIFSLALPALVAVAAAVTYVLGNGRETLGLVGAIAVVVVAALGGFALGYVLQPYMLLIVLIVLALGGAALSTIMLKSKGDAT